MDEVAAGAEGAGAPPGRGRRLLRWGGRLAACALTLLGLAAAWLVLGLESTPLAPGYAGPAALPPEVAARFRYPEEGTPVGLHVDLPPRPEDEGSTRFVQFWVTSPGDPRPHLVQVIHYRSPLPGPRPAVVVTPIMGGDNWFAKQVAAALAGRGLHAAVVLRAEKVFQDDAPEARLERVLRTAIIDRRRTVDWLQGLEEVAPGRIGAFGISMGGIATSIFASVEPRVRATVLVMAGGDLGEVVVCSEEPSLRRYVKSREARGQPADETRRRIAEAVVSDPVLLAPYLDARRVLMVASRRDRSVPWASQEKLYEALGRPRRHVLPTGHYTAVVYLPFILSRALEFLEERLGPGRDGSSRGAH